MEYKRPTKIIVEGFDILDTTKLLALSSKKAQAKILAELELLIPDSEQFKFARKVVLDATNDFVRDVIKNLFGEVDM